MTGYRDEMGEVARDARWTFFRFLPLGLGVLIIVTIVGFVLHSFGLIGSTVVQRKVFEQSYQRSEALVSQIATDEATIAEIQAQLRNPNLDEDTRFALEAQLAAARQRIATARSKQR